MGSTVRPKTLCATLGRVHLLIVYSEAWRYTGPFSRWNRFKGLFPGLGTATVLFAGYLAYEQVFLSKDHEHGHAHEESHH
jgi:hypothetical protein